MREDEGISIFKYGDLHSFLDDLFRSRCLRNTRYSRRAFARDLNMSPSSISRAMQGKSTFRPRILEAIAERLNLDENERRYLMALENREKAEDVRRLRQKELFRSSSPDFQLSLQEFALVIVASLWDGFRMEDVRALFPGKSERSLLRACLKLENLSWLKRLNGIWVAPYGFFRKAGDDPSQSVRAFHRKILEMGMERLTTAPVTERFFYSTLFTLSMDEYQLLCKDVENFVLQRSDALRSREAHDRIYALGMQLLPITRPFASRKSRKKIG